MKYHRPSWFLTVLLLKALLLCSGCVNVQQAPYLSTMEREHIRIEVRQLRLIAEKKFQEQAYLEAFIAVDEARRKARMIQLSGNDRDYLIQQSVVMREKYVAADTSPLMQVFKESQHPIKERQGLLLALRNVLVNRSLPTNRSTLILDQCEYAGTLTQILTHPQISWDLKEFLLITIEENLLRHEQGYYPEGYWPFNAEILRYMKHYETELTDD